MRRQYRRVKTSGKHGLSRLRVREYPVPAILKAGQAIHKVLKIPRLK